MLVCKFVKEIGKRFPNDPRIGFQIASAIMRRNKKRVNTVKKSVKSDKKEKAQLNRIKTQLCYDKIDYSTIETLKKNTDISEFKKVISLLAICEKKKMRSEANRIAREYVTENEQEKKIIKETLPKELTYVAGSANYGEPVERITNDDGTTTLIWEKYNCNVGEEIEPLTFQSEIDPDTANETTLKITSVIEPDREKIGLTALDLRTYTNEITIVNLTSHRLYKEKTTEKR